MAAPPTASAPAPHPSQTHTTSCSSRNKAGKPVNVYVVLCDGSIDRKLESLVQDKGDASELCLDGRLLGERTEEANLAELLRVAHREFDARTSTIDEALLAAQWPALKARLTAAMLDWDCTAGVPVATAVQTPAPLTHKGVVKVQAQQSDWRARMKDRAQRLAAQTRPDLGSLL